MCYQKKKNRKPPSYFCSALSVVVRIKTKCSKAKKRDSTLSTSFGPQSVSQRQPPLLKRNVTSISSGTRHSREFSNPFKGGSFRRRSTSCRRSFFGSSRSGAS